MNRYCQESTLALKARHSRAQGGRARGSGLWNPGSGMEEQSALKGRHSNCFAPSGLVPILSFPRACALVFAVTRFQRSDLRDSQFMSCPRSKGNGPLSIQLLQATSFCREGGKRAWIPLFQAASRRSQVEEIPETCNLGSAAYFDMPGSAPAAESRWELRAGAGRSRAARHFPQFFLTPGFRNFRIILQNI